MNFVIDFLCSVLNTRINKRYLKYVNITIKYLLNEISSNQSVNLTINKNPLVKFCYKTPDNSQSYFNPSSRTPLHALACSRRVVDNVPLDVGEGEVHNPPKYCPWFLCSTAMQGASSCPRTHNLLYARAQAPPQFRINSHAHGKLQHCISWPTVVGLCVGLSGFQNYWLAQFCPQETDIVLSIPATGALTL